MREILRVVLSMSLSGTAVGLALWALLRFAGARLPPACRYYLWIIVLARLLLPFSPPASVMSFLFPMPALCQTAAEREPAAAPLQTGEVANPSEGDGAFSQGLPPLSSVWRQMGDLAGLVWLCVAVVLFVRGMLAAGKLRRAVCKGGRRVEDARILRIYRAACARQQTRKPPALYENKAIDSPMLVGLLRPVVAIPGVPADGQTLYYSFLHELSHHRRWDPLYQQAMQLVACMHWFNPVVRLVRKETGRNGELYCDACVVKDMSPPERRRYGDTLLAYLRPSADAGGRSLALTGDARDIQERLAALMKKRKDTVGSTLLSAALAAALTLGAAAMGAADLKPASPSLFDRLTRGADGFHWESLEWGMPQDQVLAAENLTEEDVFVHAISMPENYIILRDDSPAAAQYAFNELRVISTEGDAIGWILEEHGGGLRQIMLSYVIDGKKNPLFDPGRPQAYPRFLSNGLSRQETDARADAFFALLRQQFGQPDTAGMDTVYSGYYGEVWGSPESGQLSAVLFPQVHYPQIRSGQEGESFCEVGLYIDAPRP